jgi:hypothetical protein
MYVQNSSATLVNSLPQKWGSIPAEGLAAPAVRHLRFAGEPTVSFGFLTEVYRSLLAQAGVE